MLLANVYHTFHVRHEKKKGLMFCCILLLYLWFTTHVFKDAFMIKRMNNYDWSQKIASLAEKSILWLISVKIWYLTTLNLGNYWLGLLFSTVKFPNL